MNRSLPILSLPLVGHAAAEKGWWMTGPIRWVQTNLRQVDASLDAARFAQQLADLRANRAAAENGRHCCVLPGGRSVSLSEPATAATASCAL
jgi:hypothetical protein